MRLSTHTVHRPLAIVFTRFSEFSRGFYISLDMLAPIGHKTPKTK